MRKRGKRDLRSTIFQKKNCRGLSTIVVTLIVILVSIVAVGIVWVVVRNVIQGGTEQLSLGQFTLDAKIMEVSINYTSNSVSLNLRRNSGTGEFSKISFVFHDERNSEVITEEFYLNQLEEKRFNFYLTILNVSELISVSIVPMLDQDGKEILGNVLDKYTIYTDSEETQSEGSCIPATCASLGYECGTNWANGSCSGTFNCEPPDCATRYGAGYSCNSSGRCALGTCTPDNCAAHNYECGTNWANGSCSGTFNCEPPDCITRYRAGYSCNATGSCVLQIGFILTNYNFATCTPETTCHAWLDDVDIFPFAGATANRNTHAYLGTSGNSNYTSISSLDTGILKSVNPGSGDEIFQWYDFEIDEDVNDITNLNFTFIGNKSGSSAAFSIWVMRKEGNIGTNWASTTNWTQLGATENIDVTQVSFTRNLSSEFVNYINDSGWITFGILNAGSNVFTYINYVEINVTARV